MRRGGVRKSGWLGAAALCMAAAALCGLLWRGKPPAEEGEQPPEAPKAEAEDIQKKLEEVGAKIELK